MEKIRDFAYAIKVNSFMLGPGHVFCLAFNMCGEEN